MSDASTPNARVRAAADRLKAALDEHLAAVETRTGEADPAVYAAFRSLREALVGYDGLLYEVHDEVTPYDVVEHLAPDTEGVEVTDRAEIVLGAADEIPEAVLRYVTALEDGDGDLPAVEEEVARALELLVAAVEHSYGRRLRPRWPAGE